MTLKEIQLELATETSPVRLAEFRVILAHKYGEATDQLEMVLLDKPSLWNEMRKDYKSDTATERAWDATTQGKQELHWKLQLKKIEKMMSSIKSLVDARNTEYFNSNT